MIGTGLAILSGRAKPEWGATSSFVPQPGAASFLRRLGLLAGISCSDSFRWLTEHGTMCDTGPVALGDRGHGAAGMCGIERCGARAVGGNCGRPKPAAQTH